MRHSQGLWVLQGSSLLLPAPVPRSSKEPPAQGTLPRAKTARGCAERVGRGWAPTAEPSWAGAKPRCPQTPPPLWDKQPSRPRTRRQRSELTLLVTTTRVSCLRRCSHAGTVLLAAPSSAPAAPPPSSCQTRTDSGGTVTSQPCLNPSWPQGCGATRLVRT